MAKVKIFNKTKQLLNLICYDKDTKKEINLPLVSKGCIAIDSMQMHPYLGDLRKSGKIDIERPVPEKIVEKIKKEYKKRDKDKDKD